MIVLCSPMDERDAYKVKDVVYDAAGDPIGLAEKTKFVPKENMDR
jgi:hypothetical protein